MGEEHLRKKLGLLSMKRIWKVEILPRSPRKLEATERLHILSFKLTTNILKLAIVQKDPKCRQHDSASETSS